MPRSAFIAAAFLLTIGVAVVARATAVAIDPTRLHLSAKTHSQSLALRNSGTEKARFQVSAFSWQQSPGGEMQLTPTEDILFFPSLLQIAPGETRKVRVATNVPPETIEKSYRLFVDELPPPNANTTGAIRVLTRLGIPLFLQPTAPLSRAALNAEVKRGHLLVALENRGNSFLFAQSVRVVGRDASGKVRLEQDLPAWYVLAHGRRAYDVALDETVCDQRAHGYVQQRRHGERDQAHHRRHRHRLSRQRDARADSALRGRSASAKLADPRRGGLLQRARALPLADQRFGHPGLHGGCGRVRQSTNRSIVRRKRVCSPAWRSRPGCSPHGRPRRPRASSIR